MQNNFKISNWMKVKNKILAISLILLLAGITPVSAFDFSDWDSLIQRHVMPKKVDGILIHAVNYENLKKDSEFSNLVSRLESVHLDSLKTRDEKLVFWINTYNILAAKMVVDHFPIKSINDIGFSETARIYSLSDSKKSGGNLGWIYKNQLSKEIINELNEITIGNFTKPIITSGGFLIIKLNDIKSESIKIDKSPYK